MHGTWCELDGVPSVGSLRLETIDRNDVTFESFPPDRLHDFIRNVTAARDRAAGDHRSGREFEAAGREPRGVRVGPPVFPKAVRRASLGLGERLGARCGLANLEVSGPGSFLGGPNPGRRPSDVARGEVATSATSDNGHDLNHSGGLQSIKATLPQGDGL